MSGVVVANAGSIAGLNWIASALARAGLLRLLSVGVDERRAQSVAPSLPGPIAREFRRRRLPSDIPADRVAYDATAAELAFVAANRLHLTRTASALLARRNRVFAERVARRIRPTDTAVISAYGAAVETLERARALDVTTILDYPTVHHAFAEETLRTEARLRPELAATLPRDVVGAEIGRIEQELELADRIVSLSSFQTRTFVDAGIDEDKLVLAPRGVDVDTFRPRTRRDDAVFRILYVGRLTQAKGLSYLLDGAAAAGIPNAQLTLVGRPLGPSAAWHRPGVEVRPHVPQWELADLYRQADVFVFPSLVDAFGQVVLEAMASGVPVVVSENSLGHDVVTDGVEGYVVPVRDADAIAERLRSLHAHPDARARMGSAARARAEEYAWPRSADAAVEALLPTTRLQALVA